MPALWITRQWNILCGFKALAPQGRIHSWSMTYFEVVYLFYLFKLYKSTFPITINAVLFINHMHRHDITFEFILFSLWIYESLGVSFLTNTSHNYLKTQSELIFYCSYSICLFPKFPGTISVDVLGLSSLPFKLYHL